MLDKNLLLADGLTPFILASSPITGAFVDLSGPQVTGLSLLVMAPIATGTTPTLDIVIECSDNGTTKNGRDYKLPQITTANIYRITIKQPSRYVRHVSTLTGTTANFGGVVMGFTFGGDQAKF
jgi:hypothetical protein